MGVFKDILKSDETLFRDTVALDYDYIPKLIPYREAQQKYIAACIKPLFMERNGKNLVVHGKPGVGKTVAVKHLLKEIEEESEEIIPVYINCWQRNSTFKIILEMCEALDYKFIQNKRSEELFKIIKQMLNKKSVVFVFDEIDKAEDYDFLYNILEEIYRKTIVLITNDSQWIHALDQRIKSRLIPDNIEFKPYNLEETKGILKERLGFAFIENAWETDAFEAVVKKACELGDIRSGLYLLKEAGTIAENSSSRKITLEYVSKAIGKLDEFSIKDKDELEDETKQILDIVRENSGKKIGELFKIYESKGGKSVYKTFQRKINRLGEGKFIVIERVTGAEGNTSMIKMNTAEKKLSDY